MKTLGLLLLLASTVPAPSAPILEERRTFYPDGRPYEVRHFFNGREEGLQQAWAEDGTLYINYEMRNGRRYGFINARPCLPVEALP
jgi:antitoxin component YwqK of YwqJK toxin-antitoxin module